MSDKQNRNEYTAELTPKELEQRKKRRKFIRQQRRMRGWTIFFVIILGFYVVLGSVGAYMIKDMTKDMPKLNVDDFIGDESSNIYDGNGNLLIEVGTYYRENVDYSQMPESLIDAFLSIEDSRFFAHNGFDLPRFTAAAIHNVTSGDLTGQGGSTFTMQLVKNSYFSVDDGDQSTSYSAGKGIKYKVQQILLAMQLEKKLNKEQIFELYVNRLNFGQNIRGVEMAARYYFGKSASQLNLSESALLAGIVNMPNTYNPYYYLDYATDRRNEVLDMMVYHGYITQDECDLAKSIKIEDQLVGEYADIEVQNNTYQEYIDVVLTEAQQLTGLDPYNVGMNIYTALDTNLQDLIMSIENGSAGVTYGDDLMQSAITVLDHTNGEIVALGGGRNYGSEGGARLMNRATDMYKNPGSTMKPILPYALGFEYLGFSIDEHVPDYKYSYPGESRTVADYDRTYKGVMDIKDAVADSRNIPAIVTLQNVQDKFGTDVIVNYMHSIGFDSMDASNFHLCCAIGSETFTATVTQMAAAHGAIMNLGVYNQPHTIRSVETSSGDTYYPDSQNVRVLSSGSAWLSTELMRNNVDQTKYYNYMKILNRDYDVFAKTGTSDYDDSLESYGIPAGSGKDEWMIASNSKYTNAVWTGWDEAVAGAQTYFTSYKYSVNTSGNINSLLIDKEAEITSDAAQSLTKPDDLEEVTYIQNTWPHVKAGKAYGSTVTSTVSTTGLKNTPMVDSMSDAYRVTASGYVKGQSYDSYSYSDYSSDDYSSSTTTNDNSTTDQTITDNSNTDTGGTDQQQPAINPDSIDNSGTITDESTTGDDSSGDGMDQTAP
ncbi:MAG: penicillin-binding protein [Solobacterium sp.]|jgi:penicillin-binding protein 1A|nr:penicillin-binding protein [Solobacterium sp.]MCH4049867.1 penicillin-binding protein [Solobacterium sp.]MCH4073552.1 penicillin-binding protein [Solobacterium sp.]MCI1312923.1 penicillin-binding protein [Solobacterium sp.]MCI1345993.1 penicillin-binding protein [Solobacterium sp.]